MTTSLDLRKNILPACLVNLFLLHVGNGVHMVCIWFGIGNYSPQIEMKYCYYFECYTEFPIYTYVCSQLLLLNQVDLVDMYGHLWKTGKMETDNSILSWPSLRNGFALLQEPFWEHTGEHWYLVPMCVLNLGEGFLSLDRAETNDFPSNLPTIPSLIISP